MPITYTVSGNAHRTHRSYQYAMGIEGIHCSFQTNSVNLSLKDGILRLFYRGVSQPSSTQLRHEYHNHQAPTTAKLLALIRFNSHFFQGFIIRRPYTCKYVG